MQGFTFMEVLLSLGLMASISLGMLSQQSHLVFLLKQKTIRFHESILHENQRERSQVWT